MCRLYFRHHNRGWLIGFMFVEASSAIDREGCSWYSERSNRWAGCFRSKYTLRDIGHTGFWPIHLLVWASDYRQHKALTLRLPPVHRNLF